MSVITLYGSIVKKGSNDHGEWALVAEPNVKRDGEAYEKRYMVSAGSSASVPAIGTAVLVSGYGMAKVREYDGKHYADISVSGAHFFPLGGAVDDAPASASPDDEEIPF